MEKKVTRKRKEDFFEIENLEDLEEIIHNFLENKIDPSKREKKKFVIYQNSTFRKYWDITIIIILVYICTFFPYRICFYNNLSERDFFYWFENLIDIIFFLDIIVNFFSAVEHNGSIVDNRKEIAIRYMWTWFLLDLCAM